MLQKNWSELIKPTKMEVNVDESNGRIGKLIAEPLERGFGLTLGNSIRRILLSSLQGAAITSVKIIKKNTQYSLLELNPITGRKHQLRKQLYNRGHPVIGDQKYYINKNNNHKKISMMLHAHKIKFIKNNEKFTYQAKFDKEFAKRLNSCFR